MFAGASAAGADADTSRQSTLQLAVQFMASRVCKLSSLTSLSLAHRAFRGGSWSQRTQVHCRKSCGLACVILLVMLFGVDLAFM